MFQVALNLLNYFKFTDHTKKRRLGNYFQTAHFSMLLINFNNAYFTNYLQLQEFDKCVQIKFLMIKVHLENCQNCIKTFNPKSFCSHY